jgi:hypothetical protein
MSDTCDICGGPLIHLGRLGALLHYRCRNCGHEQSAPVVENAADRDAEGDCLRCGGPADEAGRYLMTDRRCPHPCHDRES